MISEPRKYSRFDDTADHNDEEQRILDVVKEYQAEWEKNGKPSRVGFLNRHPDLADALIDYLDGVDMLQQNAKALSSVDSLPTPFNTGLKAGDRLGEFELIRELGRGGMGIVFEAHQSSLNRRVAIKVLPEAFALDRTRLQRFLVEAQAAAAVIHPHIVPIYTIGEDRGIPFYVMRLIDGSSLDSIASRVSTRTVPPHKETTLRQTKKSRAKSEAPVGSNEPQLESRESVTDQLLELSRNNSDAYFRAIAFMGSQVARALDQAHQCGVIHRDIKPANLLLDREGHIWVTDFGLALFADGPSVSKTGTAIGTLRYMSPEQAAGDRRRLDHRTDVYSLAVTMYELLTGKPAYDADSPPALLHQIATVEPPRLRNVDDSIQQDLETILLKAMQKEPTDRYTTSADFADDLVRFLERKPILARRPWPWDRALKWASLHPGILTATLSGLSILTLTFVVAYGMVSFEHSEAKKALKKEEQAVEKATIAEKKETIRANEAEQYELLFSQNNDRLVNKSAIDLNSNATAYLVPHVKTLRFVLTNDIAMEKLITNGNSVENDVDLQKKRNSRLADLNKRISLIREFLADYELKTESAATFLLFHHDVKTELGLTAEQREPLDEKTSEMEKIGRKSSITTNWLMDDKAKSELFKKLNLNVTQRLRLKQIHVQYRGPDAFRGFDVIEALDLNLEQNQDIIKVLSSEKQPRRPLSYLSRCDGVRPKVVEGLDPKGVVFERILEILTLDQKKRWQELYGAPFVSQKQ